MENNNEICIKQHAHIEKHDFPSVWGESWLLLGWLNDFNSLINEHY